MNFNTVPSRYITHTHTVSAFVIQAELAALFSRVPHKPGNVLSETPAAGVMNRAAIETG